MPVDRPIWLRLDRPLLPASATRQAINVYTGAPGIGAPFLRPEYDVLDRTLRYRWDGWLEPRALYRLELALARERGQDGLRAYDGAPLEPGNVPSALSFFTSSSASSPSAAPAPSVPRCDDIVQLFADHCASGCCHGGDAPAMGLRLDSKLALSQTAIARVAHQSETGNSAGVTLTNPARFGVSMPIIDPGSAATSYLIYKLMLEPRNLRPCATAPCRFEALEPARACAPLSDEERERVAAWFVRGDAMPPLESGVPADCLPRFGALDCGETRALARFIDSGALCP